MTSSKKILAASAVGALLVLGVSGNATAGHSGYVYGAGYGPDYGKGGYHVYHSIDGMPGRYGYGKHSPAPMKSYMRHPVMGIPVPMKHGYGYGNPHANGHLCGNNQKTGYFIKTGMKEAKTDAGNAPSGDIVDVAAGAGSFTTLVEAVKAADLVETLKGEGPFTVFAPTDDAFAKIDKADLDALLADKEKLTAVLTYHVVPGKVLAADVVKLKTAKTVQGESVTIDTSDGVKVDNATVVKTDIMASNGVIHVIDTVIMPK